MIIGQLQIVKLHVSVIGFKAFLTLELQIPF